jgi:segregation and condensation protein B
MNLSQQLEAILFWKAEPISIKKLASFLSLSEDAVRTGLTELEQSLQGRGITLVRTQDDVMLGTAKELSSLIQKITQENISTDLGKSGLETLSIILYRGPISRTDIDYIRGVNSQFIIRNLLVRGLIERVDNPKDSRSYLYTSSLELLSHLGLSKVTDLPDYEAVSKDIDSFQQSTETPVDPEASVDATIES